MLPWVDVYKHTMARVSIKSAIISLGIFSMMVTVYQWGSCDIGHRDDNFYRENVGFQPRVAQSFKENSNKNTLKYKEIECVINGEDSQKCRREAKEVYMPFSFIQKYFEVYGSIESYDGYERFEFQHSYSKVHPIPEEYSPGGIFMSFEFYNVEERNRVKCLTGQYGVPMSTQWTSSGHYYPIQIAQFGLSHYSKHLAGPKPKVQVLEDGESGDTSEWLLPDRRSQLAVKTDVDFTDNSIIEFDTSENLKNPGITISMDEKKLTTLSLDIKFISNGSLTVLLRTGDGNLFRIHYVLGDTLIYLQKRDLYYGLGSKARGKWLHITRMVMVDFQKGLALSMSKSKVAKFKRNARIAAICLRGHGLVDNVTLSSAAHLEHFFDAANYLVNQQDDQGGWPIMVQRKLVPAVLELDAGWYSAMGQGQSISLLVRAYIVSKDQKYLDAAERALDVFEIKSGDGGVLTKFAGVYDWYEEYPTTPSSYVLNGFIYSLLGLYDLKEVASGKGAAHATRLFDVGMKTLKNMLLMFDSGSGTFYDLRHLTLGGAPNRARWDYHTVHINQLNLLSLIDNDPLFTTTAKRWTDYMKGKLSPHN
ncbi:heparosan-N-sulfate-glucuronate 5-epimerase [Mytilus galloprovincialis]|uniref:heparosan-N-sulfate-glucuronate 5-epimerase n=2 Tax=Mytilus galloprovincialis TaxID=29158 RepID=A0A8B6GUZ4_MYTGA|nr:heparosan-N-sulfate-glucuronate 5-epimerase [Mytilus galloprovincialis]